MHKYEYIEFIINFKFPFQIKKLKLFFSQYNLSILIMVHNTSPINYNINQYMCKIY